MIGFFRTAATRAIKDAAVDVAMVTAVTGTVFLGNCIVQKNNKTLSSDGISNKSKNSLVIKATDEVDSLSRNVKSPR